MLGVTRSIATYRIADLASMLKKIHADAEVIIAKNVTEFISPVTFESLTGKKCLVETFDRDFGFGVEHVALVKRADVFLIAPASTSVIGKVNHGIADDILTTTFLACGCHKIIAPAMNTRMYENPIPQGDLERCESYGMEVLKPAVGYLACSDTGIGEVPEPEMLFDYIMKVVGYEKDMVGKKVLVTVGLTREATDPVRFITNHPTGKMGYVVTRVASLRGANMTLVSRPISVEAPRFVKVVPVKSAKRMYEAVTAISGERDIIVKAAAVTDHRPAQATNKKMKEKDGELSIDLCRTDDTLRYLGGHKRDGRFLCGFSMETQNTLKSSRAKLSGRHLDMIMANNLEVDGAGFGTNTSVVTIIIEDEELELEKMSKEEMAGGLLDEITKRTARPTW